MTLCEQQYQEACAVRFNSLLRLKNHELRGPLLAVNSSITWHHIGMISDAELSVPLFDRPNLADYGLRSLLQNSPICTLYNPSSLYSFLSNTIMDH